MGLMDKPLTDDAFFTALADAAGRGLEIRYEVRSLQRPDHPNSVEIELTGENGQTLALEGRSIGGGEVEITRVADLPVLFNGSAYEVALAVESRSGTPARVLLSADEALLDQPQCTALRSQLLITVRRSRALPPDVVSQLDALAAGGRVYESSPVYFPHVGRPLLTSGKRS